jgi:hypothetical protein
MGYKDCHSGLVPESRGEGIGGFPLKDCGNDKGGVSFLKCSIRNPGRKGTSRFTQRVAGMTGSYIFFPTASWPQAARMSSPLLNRSVTGAQSGRIRLAKVSIHVSSGVWYLSEVGL